MVAPISTYRPPFNINSKFWGQGVSSGSRCWDCSLEILLGAWGLRVRSLVFKALELRA